MKAIFISHNKKDFSNGVWKKMVAQVSALKNLGMNVDFAFATDGGLCVEQECGINIEKYLPGIFRQLFYRELKKYIGTYDVAYIRKPHGGIYSIFLVGLLKKLKKINPKIKIFYEIPTYPYVHEFKTSKAKILNAIYDISFYFFKSYINEILIIGERVNSIAGIKTRNITNGVDIATILPISEKKVLDDFVIVAVANLSYWHGYDRLIKSIAEYKGSKRVVLHIIGDTEPEFSRLRDYAKSFSINTQIVFHGAKYGDKIREILETAHVCVDAIGRHRSCNNFNSSIKSKEYVALGLPFIKSHSDSAFGDKEEFIYQIDPTDNTFSISNLISWRKQLNKGFSKDEREYAVKYLTWEKQFSFIVNDFKEI